MVKIELNDKAAIKGLKEIAVAVKQPRLLYGALGEELKKIHRQRFSEQKSPEGKAWKALSPKYQARKHKNKDKILQLRSTLRNTLAYNFDDKGVEFGSARVYARIHQFGGKKKQGRGSGIPARPWLGVNSKNNQQLELKAKDILQQQLRKIIN